MNAARKIPQPDFKIIWHGKRHVEFFGPTLLLKNLAFLAKRSHDEKVFFKYVVPQIEKSMRRKRAAR
jgi:hypothetical protein